MFELDRDAESRSNHGGSGHNSLSSDVAYETGDSSRACLTLAQFKSYLLLGFYSLPLCWFMVGESGKKCFCSFGRDGGSVVSLFTEQDRMHDQNQSRTMGQE